MQKDKRNNFLMKLAICSAGYGVMSDSAIIPLVTALFTAYPDTSLFMQNFIISGNMIIGLPAGFLAGVLMKKLSKRKLLIFGTLLFCISGIGCAFAPNMTVLAVLRGLDSASDGILTVVTASMIVELWNTEKDQAQVFGWNNALSYVFGAIISLFAGYGATISWRVGFAINAISLVSLILIILFVPETGILDSGKREEEIAEWEKDLKFNFPDYLFTNITFFISSVVCGCSMYMTDVYITEKGFGGSVVTGYLSSVIMAVNFVSAAIAAPVLEKFKNKSFFVVMMYAVMGIEFVYYYFAESVTGLFIVTILASLVNGWAIFYWSLYSSRTVPYKFRGTSIALYNALMYLSAFLAPYILELWGAWFGDNSVTGSNLYGGILCLVIAALYLIRATVMRKETKYL